MSRNDREVTIWNRTYGPDAVGGDRQDIDSWNEPYLLAEHAPDGDPVAFAADVIEAEGCNFEPSSVPGWAPGTWYSAEPSQDYQDGTWTERTAHLRGFTETEERDIYTRVAWLTRREPEPATAEITEPADHREPEAGQ